MKDIIRMNQLAGIITEGQAKKMMEVLNENNEFSNLLDDSDDEFSNLLDDSDDEFSNLLDDLDEDLKEYNGDEITYEDDPDSMEIGITIYPGYREEEIVNSINAILEKNTSFEKKKIKKNRGRISFDIVKKQLK